MKRLILSVIITVVFLSATTAQQVPAGESFYQAIRNNDLTALRTLIDTEGANTKLSNGLTPLMLALSFGTHDAANVLIAGGADVNARTGAGVTPLHVAWRDEAFVRLLLEHGAAVNVKSALGATPLFVAASANGTAKVVALLLDGGADPNITDSRGMSPLIASARVGNTDAAKLLLERGADPNLYAGGVGAVTSTPLMAAAFSGDVELTRLFLARKPNLGMASTDAEGTVKNGAVAFGRFTALHLAAMVGSSEIVNLLLNAGAPIDPRDIRGFTPLMMAIATDHPSSTAVRLLVEHGADASIASNAGETVLDWARKFNNADVMKPLKMPVAKMSSVTAGPATYDDTLVRQAVQRSLPLLHTGSSRVMSDGGCVACHAQPLTAIATEYASRRGWYTDTAKTDVSQPLATLTTNTMNYLQARDAGGLPEAREFDLFMMATVGVPPSVATDAFAYYLAAKQRPSGNWHGGGNRPPMEDSDFNRTALGIRALTTYGTPARKVEFESRIKRAAAWLAAETPMSTDERNMQLLGLLWAQADQPLREKRLRELTALQRSDGGWAQTPCLDSDAYATGQVLFTLHELGITEDDAIRRGVAFLLHTQASDGSWHVKSRAMKLQPYFQSGFPYEHDQWISQSGTAWAVIGLSTATNRN